MKEIQDEPLNEFVNTYLNRNTCRIGKDIIPNTKEILRISHIASLYEFCEELQAKIILDSLDQIFMDDPDSNIANDFKEFVNSNVVPIESIQTAFRRLIVRYLTVCEINLIKKEQMLIADLISRPSLWPNGVLEDDRDLNQYSNRYSSEKAC